MPRRLGPRIIISIVYQSRELRVHTCTPRALNVVCGGGEGGRRCGAALSSSSIPLLVLDMGEFREVDFRRPDIVGRYGCDSNTGLNDFRGLTLTRLI